MTWSRLILILWFILALGTAGLYVRALAGQTLIYLDRYEITIASSVVVLDRNRHAGSLDWIFISWDKYDRIRRSSTAGNSPRTLHWDRIDLGQFDSGDWLLRNNYNGYYVKFPLWFPFVVMSALLCPFFTSARRREGELRARVGSADSSQESAPRD